MFRIYKEDKLLRKRNYLPDPNSLRLFLISGILGFSSDWLWMTEKLFQKSRNKREIWCFNDTRNTLKPNANNTFDQQMYLSLDEQATIIKNGIFQHHNGTDPIVIGAYSYGCQLAALVSTKILEELPEAKITLYIIDGSTPACSSDYLQENSIEMNQNLLEIMNYACKKAGYCHLDVQEKDSSFITLLQQKSFDEKFIYLKNIILQMNQAETNQEIRDNFETYFAMIQNDLTHSYNDKIECDLSDLELIKLIITKTTKENYHTPLLGWPQKTQNPSILVLRKTLSDVPHTKLLAEESASVIGENLHDTMTTISSTALERHAQELKELLESGSDDSESEETVSTSSNEEMGYTSSPDITLNDASFSSSSATSEEQIDQLSNAASSSSSFTHTPINDPLRAQNLPVNSDALAKRLTETTGRTSEQGLFHAINQQQPTTLLSCHEQKKITATR